MKHPAKTLLALMILPLFLAACVMPLRRDADAPASDTPVEPAPVVVESPDASVLRPLPRPGGSTEPQTPPAPAADGLLGETLAGLGSPAERGLWLSTGLVDRARPGRIETASGGTLEVELRPSGAAPGAGSHLSLQAMQALGLPLGQLATLRVFAR